MILSINEVGGLKHDIEDSELAGIVQTLDAMRPDYEAWCIRFWTTTAAASACMAWA